MTAVSRRILLVDCDAFFVQVARLEDPDGAGRAPLLIVGGRPEGRGVVASASYEARAFGVRSAMPVARAVRLCPRAMVVPVSRTACRERSRAVRLVLERFAPIVEAASIDEFYLDLSGTEAMYRGEPLEATAERIRRVVLEETRIAVSIGGGSVRLVAKLAVTRGKPAGVFVVPAGGEADFLREHALSDLPGVGPKLAERLARFNLRAVADALRQDEPTLCRWLGEETGRWLFRQIRGVDASVVGERAGVRSISREETFARDLDDDDILAAELLRLIVRAGADLRDEGLRARTVTVRIRDGDFRTRQAGRTLETAIETDPAIHGVARELLEKLRRARPGGTRLLGVTLSGFGPRAGSAQLAIFEEESLPVPLETERDRKLARAVDRLRQRFGPSAVVPGRIRDTGGT